MPAQMSFAGFDTESLPKHRLFFAIFPDADTAVRIAKLAWRVREEHKLKGRLLAAERLHVTLHHLGDHVDFPQDIVAAAREVGETIATEPFDLAFDCVGSFTGRPGNRPLTLHGGDRLTALAAFQQWLGLAMKKGGLGRWAEWSFTPHVTLLYDSQKVDEQLVDPIGWTVREFVLVHSLLGETRHISLARWPLRG